MRVLILNFILSTAVDGKILRRKSNHDTMIYTMARGFVANGHEVRLLASEDFRPLEPERNEFEVVYFPSALPSLFKPHLLPNPAGLRRYLAQNANDFDMVLSVESFSIPTLIASMVCPEKLMIWQEVGVYQRFAKKIPAKFWCHCIARLFMGNTRLVAMSPGARSFSKRFMKRVSDKVVAHGADETLFYPSAHSEDYFAVIAMLVKRKRVDSIIEKFADFTQKYPQEHTMLKIIGEGPEEDALKKQVEALGISDRVEFMGFLAHARMTEVERRAKAFLVNTSSDLNMVSVTEAIANGTPVLMNTVAETHAYVKKLGCGIVRDNWGADDLKTMLDRYEEFHSKAIAGRNQFLNTGVAEALVDIFNEDRAG